MLVLTHSHYDAAHLDAVKAEMASLGAPTLRAIMHNDVPYLLEGCHRARAAAELGMTIQIEEIDYPDDDSITVAELLGGEQGDFPVADITGRVESAQCLDVDWINNEEPWLL